MRLQRLNAAIAVVAIAAVWVAVGVPAGAAQADCGSLCTPVGLAVLADSDAMAAGLGNGVAASEALQATAGTASGVSGITFGQAVTAGAPVLVGGSAAVYLGIDKWGKGSVNVAAGGATGLTGASGVPAGYSVSPTFPSAYGPYGASVMTSLTVSFTADANAGVRGQFTWADKSGWGAYIGATVVTYGSSAWPTGQQHPTLVPLGYYGWYTGGSVSVGMGQVPSTRYVVEFGPMAGPNSPFPTATGIWVPAGDPISPAGSTSGQGTITRTLTCWNGTTTATVTDSIPVNVATGGTFNYPDLSCPAGMGVKSFGADLTPSGGGSTQTVIPQTDAPPDVQSIPASEPDCLTTTCLLRLFKVAPAGGTATDCGAYAMACPDWYTDPARSSDYECHWGAYVVSLDHCSVYRVPGQVLPDASIATDGTLQYEPWPPVPSPNPAGDPGPSASDCFPNGWGLFNPVEWVLLPVKCALSWAFVPSAATATDWQTFVGDVQTHPPVSIAVGGVQFTNDVIAGVNGQGDCSSLPLEMADQGLQGPTATFDLCAGVKQAAATTWGQAVELAVTVAIIGWAAWIVMHRIGRSFGSKA